MSLSLLQGYSSEEEEKEELKYDDSADDDDGAGERGHLSSYRYEPLSDPNPSSLSSLLPSAIQAFYEVSGPPEFLNNSVEEAAKDADGQKWRHGRRRISRDKNDLPAGAVMEGKAQLVGIHERVRSDVEGNIPRTSLSQPSTSLHSAPASNPDNENAAELTRMCLTCGVPKTYSSARGTVCPICSDSESAKKRGSTVKDKEKLKRMKGQSSHASWKSETEMHLRQQFD